MNIYNSENEWTTANSIITDESQKYCIQAKGVTEQYL